MQTQTCSACRRAALSAGDGFPPLLQIRCAESPEFSAGVSDREKHQQELGAAASRERAPRAGAAGWSAQGLRSLRGDAGVARPRAPGWGQLSCRRGWPGGSAAGGSLRYLSPRRWARSEPRCCPAGGQALGREIESDRRLVISLCCCMSSPCSGTVTQWGTEAKPEAFTALVERLETLTCPQSKLVIGKFCGDSVQRMEMFLGRRLTGRAVASGQIWCCRHHERQRVLQS